MYITLRSGRPFAFAGLWDTWKQPENDWLTTCTIITTEPNELMSDIHNRMPVILSQETEPLWLDSISEEAETLSPLLLPAPAEELTTMVVSNLVNSARNEGEECALPMGE